MTEVARESAEAASIRKEAGAWFDANWDPDQTVAEWWRKLAESGWGFPTWPREWFGKGLSSDLAAVVSEERRRVGALGPPSGIGPMMAGPTLTAHATREQNERWLPPMVGGREIWCQLFSEPGAGSDLASIQTRAERYGDEWIVNGQKVWTSGAQYSRWGILIARTNPDLPKHSGITYFVIDMHQPGVEVRPLKEMSGGSTFNEVFFTDARVPDADRVGEVDEGWPVALTTLANERVSLGAGSSMMGGGGAVIGDNDLQARAGDAASGSGGGMAGGLAGGMAAAFGGGGAALPMMAKMFGAPDDGLTRQDIARLYTLTEIARFTGMRAQAAAARGLRPGPEGSIGKLQMSVMMRTMREALFRMSGAGGMLAGGDAPMGGIAQMLALFSPALSIAGGTDEVQHNIIGERVLGLPKEPQVDRDVPFRELKVGTQRSGS